VYAPNRLFTVLAALIAGPKILLLLPVWLIGVALYKFMPVLTHRRAAQIFVASVFT